MPNSSGTPVSPVCFSAISIDLTRTNSAHSNPKQYYLLCVAEVSGVVVTLMIKNHFILQVSMVNPATEWLTDICAFKGSSVEISCSYNSYKESKLQFSPERSHQGQRTSVKTPSMRLVFRSLKQREDAPLWESPSWERLIQLSICSNSQHQALNGGVVYLVHTRLSDVSSSSAGAGDQNTKSTSFILLQQLHSHWSFFTFLYTSLLPVLSEVIRTTILLQCVNLPLCD